MTITRKEAIEALWWGECNDPFWREEYKIAIKMAIEALKQPEQKRGKWEDRYRSKFDGTRYWFRACSECDFERDDCNSEKDTMYCPNCGAKMEVER